MQGVGEEVLAVDEVPGSAERLIAQARLEAQTLQVSSHHAQLLLQTACAPFLFSALLVSFAQSSPAG